MRFVRWYSLRAGFPAMAIHGLRNKPFGPGGGTRRLHHLPVQYAFLLYSLDLLWGRNRIDEGVKVGTVARYGTVVIGPF